MFVSSVARRLRKSPEIRKFSGSVFTHFRAKYGSNIAIYGAIVGTCAFAFQIFALFPWHDILSNQFNTMQEVIVDMEKTSTLLDAQIENLEKLQEEIKAKERKVLDRNNEILGKSAQLGISLDELLQK